MFWRRNPQLGNNQEKQVGGDDWPRNGAFLKGKVHKLPDMDWLEVEEWKQVRKLSNTLQNINNLSIHFQVGSTKWVTGCVNLWMPFEQGGLLLHLQDE